MSVREMSKAEKFSVALAVVEQVNRGCSNLINDVHTKFEDMEDVFEIAKDILRLRFTN